MRLLILFSALVACVLSTAAAESAPAADDASPDDVDSRVNTPSLRVGRGGDRIRAAGRGFVLRPRWELGIGAAHVSTVDYPASRDPNRRTLALPFFIYRGPVIRVGGRGVRAVAVERPRLRLDVSFGASLSASAEGNNARAGLPDLDYLFEVGPEIELQLLNRRTDDGGRWQLKAATGVRGVVATDFRGVEWAGAVAEVGATLTRRRLGGRPVDLFARVDTTAADERVQARFYEVVPAFATEQRPAFDARGGYLGSAIALGLVWRPSSRLRLFFAATRNLHQGARNRDSPLFETTATTGLATGLAWTLAQSRHNVAVVELDP